jgi:hypothetical protein
VSEAVDWQVLDRALRGIAARRAALDSEEARWLREAEALQIWKPLGMVSALDYMERVLGYAPRSAQERLRVARALGALPKLDAALAQGRLAFTAVRELTRVATPANEAAWLEAATGKNLRQIEELVADHRLGDGPTDPKDPEARTHVVRFELSASTYARLRQARQALESERARSLSDDELVTLLCEAALAGGDASEADDGRAKFQVAMTVCERCRQGWQEGAGVNLPVDASTVERAMCDAQHLGSLDGDAPERAHQDVTPSVARFVRRRDGGRCRVPGCRSARGLEIHHIAHREHGGGHEASNLILLCSSCHTAHHDGILTIRGTATALEVERTPSKLDRAISHARSAHAGASQTEGVASKLDPASGLTRGAQADAGRGDRAASQQDRAIDRARGAHVDAGRGEGSASQQDRAIDRARGAHVDAGRGDRAASKQDRAIAGARGAHVDAGRGEGSASQQDRAIDGARGAHVGAGRGEGAPSKQDCAIDRARGAYMAAGRGEGSASQRDRAIDRTRGAHVGAGAASKQDHATGRARGDHVGAGRGAGAASKQDHAIGRVRGAHVGAGCGGAERIGMGGGEAERIEMGCGGAERLGMGRERGAHLGAGGGGAERIEMGGGGAERLGMGGGGAERLGMGRERGAHVGAGGGGAERIGMGGGGTERIEMGGGGAERLGMGRERGAHVGAGGGGAERIEMGGGEAERIEMCGQAKRALVDAGWSRAVASSAVAAASARLSGEAGGGSLERLLFEAFRACPRPRAT